MIKLFFLFVGIVVFIAGSAYLGYLMYKPIKSNDNLLLSTENTDMYGSSVLESQAANGSSSGSAGNFAGDGLSSLNGGVEYSLGGVNSRSTDKASNSAVGDTGFYTKDSTGNSQINGQSNLTDANGLTVPAARLELDVERVTSNTRIMYEYLTPENEIEETKEVSMPYYFLGMSEAELTESLIEGWSVKEFSEEMIVLNRITEKSTQDSYMLGVHNGYIAVYYNENAQAGSVKATINKHISSLSIDEQNRLKDGIPITDEEQLAKVLEDYGS